MICTRYRFHSFYKFLGGLYLYRDYAPSWPNSAVHSVKRFNSSGATVVTVKHDNNKKKRQNKPSRVTRRKKYRNAELGMYGKERNVECTYAHP